MAWDAKSISDALGWKWVEKRKEYAGLCPCHDPSGTHEFNAGVKDTEKGILFKCFGGCTYAEFLVAMEARGLKREVVKREKIKAKEVERYAYRDEQGDVLYYNIRYEPKDFRMARPGKNGTLEWSVKDITRRVIYRLPEILETTTAIFFVEGEKDVDSLEKLGVRATCIAGGADGWRRYAKDYTDQLTGQDIIILPDNDAPGKKLAHEIAQALSGKAKRVRILSLPGLTDHGDVTDWIRAGGTFDVLWQLVKEVDKKNRPMTYSMNDILNMEIPDLISPVQNFIHEGLWIFGGRSKRGKSWLMLDLALGVSSGQLAFGSLPTKQTGVLYVCLEDGIRRVKSRIGQLEPDMSKDYRLDVAFDFPNLQNGGMTRLVESMQQYGLIIIDVATKIMPRSNGKSDPYAETYDILSPLQAEANKHHCALILINHLRKSAADDIFDELYGSVAIQAVADALMVLERAPRENELLLHIRGKEYGEMVHALYFNGRNFQYRGEGDSFALKVEQQKIIDILLEEAPDFLQITDIMKAAGVDGNANYQRMRRSILMLQRDGFIGTMQSKGKKLYGAMAKAKYERLSGEKPTPELEDMPF